MSAPAAARLRASRWFKPHLVALERYRTSTGRDLEAGLCLDRNERMVAFPPPVLAALRKTITSATLNFYPDTDDMYAALSAWTGLPQDRLYLVNGITEAIRVVYETLTRPGDKVLALDPTYPMYRVYSKIYEVEHRPVGFDERQRPRLDQLEAQLDDKVAFVVLPNPNLPIESKLGLDELRRVASLCRDRGCFLIVDEAYGYFGAETAQPLLAEFDNVVLFQTDSKAFGLAGIRLGWMMSSAENIAYFSKTRAMVESNGPSMAVGAWMLRHPKVMRDYVKAVKQGRDELRRELGRVGARWHGGEFTNAMLVFLRDNEAAKDLVAHLRARKVYVRASFDAPLDRAVRITLGPKPAMRAFLKELKAWAKARPGALGS